MVGKIAVSAGMRINAFDLFLTPETTQVDGGELLPFDEVIKKSDFITIHTPITKTTRNLINNETISKMKDGVFIICAARGGIIDENALLDGLNSGKIGGAALDVYLDEKVNPGNPKLYELKDGSGFGLVIGSPHIGASTVEGQARVGQEVADILIEFYQSQSG